MNPETQQLIQTLLMRTMLVSMMFAMGLRLTIAALLDVGRSWGLIVWVLLANFLFAPLFALAVLWVFDVPPGASAGILVCASAPGSTVATLLSRNAGGHVPTAVALLLLLIFASLVATPFIVDVMLSSLDAEAGTFSTSAALKTIFLFQLIPLIAGMIVHNRAESLSARLEPWVAGLATSLLVVVIVGFTITRIHLVTEIGWQAAVSIAVIIIISGIAGIIFPQRPRQRVASGFASGSKNIALSILLAELYLSEDAVLSVMIFGLLTYLLLVPLTPLAARWVRRRVSATE